MKQFRVGVLVAAGTVGQQPVQRLHEGRIPGFA